ncbi:MAG: PEP-CTERM sorting domain-containing protein [Phycisphaerales bacterium]|nr:PEP-CTERM sorting domain-containing protein [Phycisphaerales bacterium]
MVARTLRRSSPVLFSAVLATAAVAGLPTAAEAAVVQSLASGDQLAGAVITVRFQRRVTGGGFAEAGTASATITGNTATQTGSAVSAGNFAFSFNVTGDTFQVQWQFQNLSTNLYIKSINFDLRPSSSLFDDGTEPSTAGSSLGRDAQYLSSFSTAQEWLTAVKYTPWTDPINTGDMFQQELFTWADASQSFNVFAPGTFLAWQDDTDYIVPAPGSLGLVAAAAGLLVRRRRR